MRKKGQYTKNNKSEKQEVIYTENKAVIKKEATKRSSAKVPSYYIIVGLLFIALITIIVYLPTFENKITNWDDDKYLIENPLIKDLNSESVAKMFFTGTDAELYWMGNYHPLTMLSLNINYQMLDPADIDIKNETFNPFIFQLTNIILHLINTLLVFWLCYLLFKNFPIAFITALLFGVHTLHVESVTWISERKDVLYTVFFLASMVFYTKYIENFKIHNIVISLFLFILSLLSKGQAVSMAVSLVAIDYLKNRKLLDLKLILEKLPFFILALIFGYIAIHAQKTGLALQEEDHYGVIKRLSIAVWGLTQYIIKLLVPTNLSAIYPYPDIISRTIPIHYFTGYLTAGGLMFLLFYFFKKSKEITFAIAFYIINIALLLQFIPVGSAIMADRYAYIPSIGFFILISVLYQKFQDNMNLKISFISAIALLTIFWSVLTYQRTKDWKDSLTIWDDVVSKQPKAVVAWNNRGSEFDKMATEEKKKKNYVKYKEYKERSIKDFSIAIEGKPDYDHAFYNRGTARKDYGEFLGDTVILLAAKKDFDDAISIDVQFAKAFQNRAIVYEMLNDLDKALSDYNRAIELAGNYDFYVNRGVIYGRKGDFDNAIKDFDFVLSKIENASAYSNRGLANDMLGNYEKSLQDYNKAIELEPNSYSYFYNRSLVHYRMKNYQKALEDISQAITLEPENYEAITRRGIYYIELKEIEKACGDFKLAASVGIQEAVSLSQKYCSK